MANANIPIGLRPINQNGTAWNGQGTLCAVPASQAGNIFLGDPVVALGGTDAYGCPLVGIATAGAANPVLGSMVSISNGPAGGGGSAVSTIQQNNTVYRNASVLNYIFICDDPNQLYVIQEDSNGGSVAASAAGFANANLVAGAGSTYTGFSGWQLQSSSVSSSANTTYQLKIIGLARGPDNTIGTYADWVVKLNNPQFASTTGV